MRESVIEQYLVDAVRAIGGQCPKYKSPNRNNVPDRLVLLSGGRVVFVEVKATGVKPEDGQIREHERLRKLGFEVRVIDSKEQVDQWLGYPGLL